FQAEDGIRVRNVTGVQTCALPIFESGRNELLRVPGPKNILSGLRIIDETRRDRLVHRKHAIASDGENQTDNEKDIGYSLDIGLRPSRKLDPRFTLGGRHVDLRRYVDALIIVFDCQ